MDRRIRVKPVKLSPKHLNCKKSIFMMKQHELWEHLISKIKSTKHEITSHDISEQSMNNLRVLNDWIEVLKIYKEMRKIISMSFNSPEFSSPEEIEFSEWIIDKKWRLTFIKWLSNVNSMLDYEIAEFKKIKLLCIQIKRIEERICSPVWIRRDKVKHMNCIDWNWLKWTRKTRIKNHALIFNTRALSH